MSENYCPSCGLQKSYGRTLAYYPDGPDLNKNICSKCGQTLMSADATIATLQRENEALRKERDGHQKRGEENALAQTPTEALARWNAMARVCEDAEHAANWLCEQFDNNEAMTVGARLASHLAALRSLNTKAGG